MVSIFNGGFKSDLLFLVSISFSVGVVTYGFPRQRQREKLTEFKTLINVNKLKNKSFSIAGSF